MHELELLFFVALVFYSVAIWANTIKKKFSLWMIWMFGAGFFADFAGTILLCVASSKKWTFTFHTLSGTASLLIMGVHFLWAVLAMSVGRKYEIYFHKCSVYAWLIWLASFVSGAIIH